MGVYQTAGTWTIQVAVLLFYSTGSLANNPYAACDYYQELRPNQSYYIYSPGYPQKYTPGTTCRWYAVAPVGSSVFLVCENMSIPPSKDCYGDRLSVSLSGDIDFKDANHFCGNERISMVSTGRNLNIALLTSQYSPGGAFICSIGVQESPSPPEGSNCDCGWKNMVRIVGGRETGVNEYPMMAALIDGQKRELFCGATIISPRYAVTAAHCLLGKQPKTIGLLVGDHDIGAGEIARGLWNLDESEDLCNIADCLLGNDTDSAQLLLIDKLTMHPNYDSETQANDIGIVRVDRPIEFNLQVGPACLPFMNTRQNFEGTSFTAVGWGATDFGGLPSKTLQKVDLKVAPMRQCKNTYGDIVSNNQICTYQKDQDACQSDSGGPLLWQEQTTRRVKLMGIISYGIQCATENPSVNTRVSQYLSWIMENADDEYCVK